MKRTRTPTSPLRSAFYVLLLLPWLHAKSNMGRLGDLPTMASDVLFSSAIDSNPVPDTTIQDEHTGKRQKTHLTAKLTSSVSSSSPARFPTPELTLSSRIHQPHRTRACAGQRPQDMWPTFLRHEQDVVSGLVKTIPTIEGDLSSDAPVPILIPLLPTPLYICALLNHLQPLVCKTPSHRQVHHDFSTSRICLPLTIRPSHRGEPSKPAGLHRCIPQEL